MSDVTLNPQPLFDLVAGAFDAAGDDVITRLAARQVKRTGKLAASYHITPSEDDGHWWWAYVASASRYALPVERGAWVGRGHNRESAAPRRGPHMKGNFVIKKNVASIYGAAMKAALPKGYKPRRTTMRPIPNTVIR